MKLNLTLLVFELINSKHVALLDAFPANLEVPNAPEHAPEHPFRDDLIKILSSPFSCLLPCVGAFQDFRLQP